MRKKYSINNQFEGSVTTNNLSNGQYFNFVTLLLTKLLNYLLFSYILIQR